MKNLLLFSSLVSVFFLGACSEVKHQLGLSRRTPDEFAVMRRAPLEVPPDVDQITSLPAPRPGALRPQETQPETEAQMAILGTPSMQAGREGMSQGEADLLSRAGATQPDPNIRALVEKDATKETKDTRPVVKRLLNIGNEHDEAPASVLDAKGEMQRLKDNKKTGAPVTKGETPVIDE